jgi:hypothetical protein
MYLASMDSFQTDWILVVIAAVLNMVIGFVWYSKWLFGPDWIKLTPMKGKPKMESASIIYGFIVSLVIAYFISFFEGHLGITNVTDGIYLGFLLWLGFVATTQISSVSWNKEPWKLFMINCGCKLLSFLVMGGIIGA